MTEQKSLGIIRLALLTSGANGPFFDFPYFDEGNFARILTQIRADGYFSSGHLFIPLSALGYIVKLPTDAVQNLQAQFDANGATRQ